VCALEQPDEANEKQSSLEIGMSAVISGFCNWGGIKAAVLILIWFNCLFSQSVVIWAGQVPLR
jgi:hypothetical protein